jgi:hypothetical protein
MNESLPLWLRVVIASIPVLVALIGGAFTLINTVNRRIERLKNLVEIRKEFPDTLNQDYAIERVMVRELNAIEKSTTPWYVWYRRSLILVLVTAYSLGVIQLFVPKNYLPMKNLLIWPLIISIICILTVSWYYIYVRRLRLQERTREMRTKQKARFELLDSLAALPERHDTESAPSDADESQATNRANKHEDDGLDVRHGHHSA